MFIREMRVYELIEVDQNGVRRLASGYFRVLKYFTHNHGLYPMGLYKYFFKCYPVFEIRNNINLTLKNAGEGGGGLRQDIGYEFGLYSFIFHQNFSIFFSLKAV